MALIEIQHVTADMYDVDPDSNPAITEGQVVTMNSTGFVALAGNASGFALGLAGDSTAEETDTGENNTPFQSELVINSKGSTRNTQNRVSDLFNESLASAKLTVYNNGGKFATDQFESLAGVLGAGGAIAYTPGLALYVANTGKVTGDVALTAGSTGLIGYTVAVPAAYPSGVPGTDTTDGSISLGTFITLHLRV